MEMERERSFRDEIYPDYNDEKMTEFSDIIENLDVDMALDVEGDEYGKYT